VDFYENHGKMKKPALHVQKATFLGLWQRTGLISFSNGEFIFVAFAFIGSKVVDRK
jgi:hypothetical protein